MLRRRVRLATALTALCIAWASLWPLVSAARCALASVPVAICHQAGRMVGIRMPLKDSPADEPKVHCPLCIMAFLAAFEPPPVAPPASHHRHALALQAHCAPVPTGLEIRLPESRAPPVTFPI